MIILAILVLLGVTMYIKSKVATAEEIQRGAEQVKAAAVGAAIGAVAIAEKTLRETK